MSSIVAFAQRQRILVVVLMFFVLGAGVFGFMKLNVEAYPDPVPPLVDIVTQSTGQSAEEMERYITTPIEIQVAGIPHVTAIRTISLFGLSDVKVQFTYDFTYGQAQQWVINRLSQLSPLPNGAQPGISPESPIGEIYRYRVVGPPGYSVTDLKTIEDWMLERRFKAVPGVIDVSGWGGKTKTFDVTIDENKLIDYGLTLPQVLQVLNTSNVNVGGQTVNFGPQSAVVRGIGLIHSMDDIRNTMLTPSSGSAVRLSDVATVTVGHLPRLGIAGKDDGDGIVQGVVLMRRGEESPPTIQRVEAEVQKINASGILPPGVRVEKIYDRSDLINVTTHTVLRNMIAGMILIFFLQWLFLGNLRTAVVVAATIPFALAFAIALMVARGESANLLSVGAIDFGLVVDATVIMLVNVYRHLTESAEARSGGVAALHGTRAAIGLGGKFATIANAATEVSQSIFFSATITVIAGFVLLFALSGIEGHIFGPMAKSYAYAILGGLIATFTITPALSWLLMPDPDKAAGEAVVVRGLAGGLRFKRARFTEEGTIVVRALRRTYRPAVEFALDNKIVTLGGLALVLVLAFFALRSLGLEFLPHREDGNLWVRATMPPSVSLEESDGYVNRMRRIIKSYPEVETVVPRHGRPDDGTDATGFFNAEFFVPLKPFDSWPSGVDKDELTEDMTTQLKAAFPGVEFNFSQYIEDNVEEAASGVKGENSVKPYGDDLQTLENTAEKIKEAVATVPGITDLAVFNSLGQPTVRTDIDRDRAERVAPASLDIERREPQLGAVSHLGVRTAEQTYQQAVLNRVQAQANRYSDTAALFQSLGGGWWNRTDVADARMRGGE